VTTPLSVAAVADRPLAGAVVPGAHWGEVALALTCWPSRIQLIVGKMTGSNVTLNVLG